MKPVIGVVSLYDETKESYWMLPGYLEGLEEAGVCSVVLPLTENGEALERYGRLCDGFLFPGGQDISPALYGQEAGEKCGILCPERDRMERRFFPIALETGKPLFGICRGVQLFNVMLGGTLYQDLPTEFPSPVEHHGDPPYDQVIHQVNIPTDSPLYEILSLDQIGVNSYHHQGIKALGRGLEIAAKAPDGLTEAVYLKGHPFAMAVQWHPEFSHKTDENSRKLFRAFVKACEKGL